MCGHPGTPRASLDQATTGLAPCRRRPRAAGAAGACVRPHGCTRPSQPCRQNHGDRHLHADGRAAHPSRRRRKPDTCRAGQQRRGWTLVLSLRDPGGLGASRPRGDPASTHTDQSSRPAGTGARHPGPACPDGLAKPRPTAPFATRLNQPVALLGHRFTATSRHKNATTRDIRAHVTA